MNPVHSDPETSGPMLEMRTFNRLTRSFCTTSSKPATSALATGVQFPNAFADPTIPVVCFRSANAYGYWKLDRLVVLTEFLVSYDQPSKNRISPFAFC